MSEKIVVIQSEIEVIAINGERGPVGPAPDLSPYALTSTVASVSAGLDSRLNDVEARPVPDIFRTEVVAVSGDLQTQIDNIVQESTSVSSSSGNIIVQNYLDNWDISVSDYISKTEVSSISGSLKNEIDNIDLSPYALTVTVESVSAGINSRVNILESNPIPDIFRTEVASVSAGLDSRIVVLEGNPVPDIFATEVAAISAGLQNQINDIVQESTTITSSSGNIIVQNYLDNWDVTVLDYISKTEVASVSGQLLSYTDSASANALTQANAYSDSIAPDLSGYALTTTVASVSAGLDSRLDEVEARAIPDIFRTEVVAISSGLDSRLNDVEARAIPDIFRTEVASVSAYLQGEIDGIDLSPYALDSQVVHITGNETISGNKTFTGAANFGDTVSIANTITSTKIGAILDAPSTTTLEKYIRTTNNGGDLYVGVENVSGDFFTGSNAYDGVVWTPGRLFLRGATGIHLSGNITQDGAGTATFGTGGVTIPSGGTLTVASDTDATTILGRARIDARITDFLALSHFDVTAQLSYALAQNSLGQTFVNSAPGQTVNLRVNNIDTAIVSSTAVTLASGINFTMSGASTATLTAVTATSITNSALTSGRIPFASTGGLLDDDASLTWDDSTKRLRIGSRLTYTAPTAAAITYFVADSVNDGVVVFQNGAGSSAFGGSIMLYGNSHATLAGSVQLGLGQAGALFQLSDSALPGGSSLFSVSRDGTMVLGGSTPSLTINGAGTFTTGTGAVLLQGNTVVGAGKTFIVGADPGGTETIRSGANARFGQWTSAAHTTNSAFRGIRFMGQTDGLTEFGSIGANFTTGELRHVAGFSTYGGYHTWHTNGAERMSLSATGMLTLSGAISASDTISSGNGSIQTVISYGASTGTMGTNSAHDLDIIAGGSSRISVSASTGTVTTTGNVGIGTTNPIGKLVVADGTNGKGLEVSINSGNILLESYDRTGANYIPARYLASSHSFEQGNCSFGANTLGSFAWASNHRALAIGNAQGYSAISQQLDASEKLSISWNAYGATGNDVWNYRNTGDSVGQLTLNSRKLAFRTAPAGTIDTAITWTDSFSIDQTQFNIGVNTVVSGNVTINAGNFLRVPTGAPATSGAAGTTGSITWDTDYMYVCTATNTWKRAALSSW